MEMTTMSVAKMNVWAASPCVAGLMKATPAQHMPYRNSAALILLRHVCVSASSRGALANCRHSATRMPLATKTVASHNNNSRDGAQNMGPMATMMARRGVAIAADSSLRTNMARSSYSNSGLLPDLEASFSRAACTPRKGGPLAPGGGGGGGW